MRHFRIIKTTQFLPDVLLLRDRDENGGELVKIIAVGNIDDYEDMFAEEEVLFQNNQSAISFIRDFTSDQAVEFCNRNNIVYG